MNSNWRMGPVGRRMQRRQSGQVLVWFLATVAASAAVLYGVYNVSQVTSAKQKTVNAADAGAFAGAMVQARALNFMAYTNRSVVANEVFVAQIVSLDSWLDYMKRTTSNLSTVTKFIPYVGTVLSGVLKAVSTAVGYAGTAVDKVLDPVLITALELFKKVHLTAVVGSNDIVYGAGGLIAKDAAEKVVAANKTDFGGRTDTAPYIPSKFSAATFVANEAEWLNFTRRYTANDRKYAKDVILRSRDGFTTDRPGSGLMNFSLLLAGLEKHGGTTLVGYNRWESEDTLEMWIKTPGWCGWHPCLKKSYVPVGWGRSTLAKSATSGNLWDPKRTAQDLALANSLKHGGWSGVGEFRDIKDRKASSRENLSIDFWIVTAKAKAATMTTSNIGIAPTAVPGAPLASAEMNEDLLSNQVNAIGKAHVFFERPQQNSADKTGIPLFREDSAKEYGSLYSPYWQARLTPVGKAEKELVTMALGGPAGTSLFTQ